MTEKITLSREQYNRLIAAERELTGVLGELDKAEACGIDCQVYRDIHAEAMKQIEALKTNYSPAK